MSTIAGRSEHNITFTGSIKISVNRDQLYWRGKERCTLNYSKSGPAPLAGKRTMYSKLTVNRNQFHWRGRIMHARSAIGNGAGITSGWTTPKGQDHEPNGGTTTSTSYFPGVNHVRLSSSGLMPRCCSTQGGESRGPSS